MRKLNSLLFTALLIVSALGRAHAGIDLEAPKDADTSERAQALVSRFRAAHAKHDIEGLMNLVRWKDVTPQTRESFRKSFQELLGKPLVLVYVSPVPKDQMTEYTLGSVHYQINLKPAGVLQIQTRTDKDGVLMTSFVVGITGKDYSIATAAPTR